MLRGVLDKFVEQYDRWPLWIPVFIGVGVAIYYSLAFEPSLIPQLGALAILTLVLCKKAWRQRPALLVLAGMALCFMVGITAASVRTAYMATPMLSAKQSNVEITGEIIDIQRRSRQHRIVLGNLTSTSKIPILRKVRLTISSKLSAKLHLGDRIKVSTSLLPLGEPVVPGGYNYRRVAFFDGIGAVGRVDKLQIVGQQPVNFIDKAREVIRQNLERQLSSTAYPITAALIIGDKSAISQSTRDAFAASGLAHLLAISGLHLSLIAALVFFLIRHACALIPRVAEYYSTKKIAAVAAIPLTAVYLAMSGFGIPAQRAFTMIAVVMLAIILDRSAISLRLVAFAATLLLLLKPESLISPSFVLSFAAVTGLVAFYESFWRQIHAKLVERPLVRLIAIPLLGIVLTTIIATLATTPYSVMFFNRFTMQGVLANLIAIPLTSFCLMPLAFICVLLPNWQWPFELLSNSIELLMQIAAEVASWPGAVIVVPTPPAAFTLLITLGFLWLAIWRGRLKLWGVGPVVAGLLILLMTRAPDGMLSKTHIALRSGDKLLILKGKNSFVLSQWQQHLGCIEQRPCQGRVSVNGTSIMTVKRGQYVQQKAITQDTDLIIAAKPLSRYLSTTTPIIDTQKLSYTPQPIWFNDRSYKLAEPSHSYRPWS